jgi:hypothetical protein
VPKSYGDDKYPYFFLKGGVGNKICGGKKNQSSFFIQPNRISRKLHGLA